LYLLVYYNFILFLIDVNYSTTIYIDILDIRLKKYDNNPKYEINLYYPQYLINYFSFNKKCWLSYNSYVDALQFYQLVVYSRIGYSKMCVVT